MGKPNQEYRKGIGDGEIDEDSYGDNPANSGNAEMAKARLHARNNRNKRDGKLLNNEFK